MRGPETGDNKNRGDREGPNVAILTATLTHDRPKSEL
jgi:hypothetical protein